MTSRCGNTLQGNKTVIFDARRDEAPELPAGEGCASMVELRGFD
jgi:hypothetical protein